MENISELYKLNKDNLVQLVVTIQKDYIDIIRSLADNISSSVTCCKEDCNCFKVWKEGEFNFEYPKNMKYEQCYNCFHATCERHTGYKLNDWQCDHCNITRKICDFGCADNVCSNCNVGLFQRK